MATDWFAIKKTTIAENTAKSLWRKFENHVFPKLGHRPIDKILAPEAIEAFKQCNDSCGQYRDITS